MLNLILPIPLSLGDGHSLRLLLNTPHRPGATGQHFGFIPLDGGGYRIVSRNTYGTKNLSVQVSSTADGANIHQYGYGGPGDFWWLESANWTEQTAFFNSGNVPTVWSVDLGDGSVTFGFVKQYSSEIKYKYNSKQTLLTYVENFTSIQQTHPISMVGQVSAINARAIVNGEMLTMYGCQHDGHILKPDTAWACNSFRPSITNLIGKTTITTYGFVNVPGPALVGGAICLDGSHQCFVEFKI